MCGIVGIFKFRESAFEITPELLIKMRETMRHRGPDGAGMWISPRREAGFAHRRLSIIDLSEAGAQPMASTDGRYCITYNGEIYNHQKLRSELEASGYRYRSKTDTETVLHSYDKWGTECVHRFEGMFAFGLWDDKRRRLWLVRDRIGIKPLYYTFVNGQIIFASEIKAILKHPHVSRDIDPVALYHYLTFVATPAPLTMFKGIYKLPAGHAMLVEQNKDPYVYQYWDAIVPKEKFETEFRSSGAASVETFCVDRIRQLLSEAIEKRMMSDVPFGVFLSGGIDSSTNVALMSRFMTRPVSTFTVGFKNNPEYNELEYARQIANEFKTDHHEILIDENDLLDYLPNLIYHQDEPIADPVCVPLYFVSKLARDNNTIVVQVGEGSDEQFCGYRWCVIFQDIYNKYWKWFRRMPALLRRPIAHTAVWTSQRVNKMVTSFAAEMAVRAAYDQELFWGGAISLYETQKPRYVNKKLFNKIDVPYFDGLGKNFIENSHTLSSADVVRCYAQNIREKKPDSDFIEQLIYLELKHRLPELLLMRVDKISMSTSVEARVPYLDHKLVEFSMNIPAHLKINNGQTKYILKKAVEGIIPDNIIYRKKQGFAAPVGEWMETKLGHAMGDAISTTPLRKRGLLRFDNIDENFGKMRSSRRSTHFGWWTLFNLIMWYDHWIEGRSIDV